MLSVYLEVDTVTTITSFTGQRKGNYSGVPPSAGFPVPYSDDFDGILRVLRGCINYSANFLYSYRLSFIGCTMFTELAKMYGKSRGGVLAHAIANLSLVQLVYAYHKE